MTDRFPLVWWWKKELPHRKGQRCRVGNLALFYDGEAWRGEVWLIEFEDGGLEWANERGARRPDRPWKDEFEHEREHCTGHWRRVRGGYDCDGCRAWVRDSTAAEEAFNQVSRTEIHLHGIVRENQWAEFIAAVEDGMPPLQLAEWMVRLRLAWPYVTGYAEAMRRNGVAVDWDGPTAIRGGTQ